VTGGPALKADQRSPATPSVKVIRNRDVFSRINPEVMLFILSTVVRPARVGNGGGGLSVDPRCGGLPWLPRPDRVVGLRDSALSNPRDRRNTDYAIFLIGRYQEARTIGARPGVGLLHDVPRHRHVVTGLGHADRPARHYAFVHGLPTSQKRVFARGRNGC